MWLCGQIQRETWLHHMLSVVCGRIFCIKAVHGQKTNRPCLEPLKYNGALYWYSSGSEENVCFCSWIKIVMWRQEIKWINSSQYLCDNIHIHFLCNLHACDSWKLFSFHQKCLIQVTFKPTFLDREIKEEGLRLLQEAALLKQLEEMQLNAEQEQDVWILYSCIQTHNMQHFFSSEKQLFTSVFSF